MTASSLLSEIWASVGGRSDAVACVEFAGTEDLPSAYAVTDLAAAACGAAALAVAELANMRSVSHREVKVDRRLATLWFGWSLQPQGWSLPPTWDDLAGNYLCADGWIRLHTNAPEHHKAALAVLGVAADKMAVEEAVQRWRSDELESAVIEHGGCAAVMRSSAAWNEHSQGRSVANEPLVAKITEKAGSPCDFPFRKDRPLAGVRVLDLTRVLAGPVATRFLAGFGADVLRVDPPWWEEPSVVPDVTLGKRCSRLDLTSEEGRDQFTRLLGEADIVVHGYRPGALAKLGFDAEQRRGARLGLVDVSLDAYGWTGPWSGRRGFDSLVQMSSGIADTGMRYFGKSKPIPLPVQALDHATGYIMAAAAIHGLAARWMTGDGCEARTSLARTAVLLTTHPNSGQQSSMTPPSAADFATEPEATAWGPGLRLRPPVAIADIPMMWDRPASELGSSSPTW